LHSSPMDSSLLRSVVTHVRKSRPFDRWAAIEHEPFSDHEFFFDQNVGDFSIVSLLDRFAEQKCTNPLDRIYSLLSLYPAEKASIPVDYNAEVLQLAYDVLRCNAERKRTCVCSVLVVIRALQPVHSYHRWYHDGAQKIADDCEFWMETILPSSAVNFSDCSEERTYSAACTALKARGQAKYQTLPH